MGFWKTLGKIGAMAAPFALAPFTGGGSLGMLALRGGIAAGSALAGNALSKSGSKPTALESPVLAQDAAAQKTGLAIGNQTTPAAQNLIGMGSQAYQPVLNYWSSILSGNRGAMTSALAPEISRIGQGYQAAGQTSTALNPRGGPSAEFNAELPYAQQRDVTTLLQGARPQAATGLLNAGQQATSAGSSLLSNAVNAIYGSTAAGRDILNQQQNTKEAEAKRSASIGKGLFDLMQKYGPDISSILKGGGSSGPVVNPVLFGGIPTGGGGFGK